MGGSEGWWVFGCTRIKGGRVSWGRRGATPIHRPDRPVPLRGGDRLDRSSGFSVVRCTRHSLE